MEPSAIDGLGFAHFLTQTDGVGKAVLGTLLLLSVASWYLIVTRFVANALAQRKADAFLRRFWQAASLTEVEAACAPSPPTTPSPPWSSAPSTPWPTAARTTSPSPGA
jgi:biopolymer transport protein ExbB/TolQ